jgi:U2-associated protein SR140
MSFGHKFWLFWKYGRDGVWLLDKADVRIVYTQDVNDQLRELFSGVSHKQKPASPVQEKEERAPTAGFKTSGFKSSFKPLVKDEPKGEDLDGEVIEDLDGEDLDGEDLDGEDLDGEAIDLPDGEPVVDLDGEEMDLDGEEMDLDGEEMP